MFFPVHYVEVAVMQEILKIKETGLKKIYKTDTWPLGIQNTYSYN